MFYHIMKSLKVLLTRRVSIKFDGMVFDFHKVSIKKIANWLVTETSVISKLEKPWSLPTHAQIEPSNLCNLRCALCPVAVGMNRPSGNMNYSVFKNLIDDIGDYLFLIILWDWGEPLLNSSIYDMIAYAKQKNIKIVTSTNTHVLAKKEFAEKLVKSGIDCVICAIDGITQESYKKYREKGDIENAIAGIKNLVSAKKEFESNTPIINLRFIPMKHNEHEIPALREFAHALGVDILTTKTLNPHEHVKFDESKIDVTDFIPQNEQYQRFVYDSVTHLRIRNNPNPCKRLWNNPSVHWNGKVSPCTFDHDDLHTMGDITEQSFRTIWRSQHYSMFRRRFRNNFVKDSFCANCTYAYLGGTPSERINVIPL